MHRATAAARVVGTLLSVLLVQRCISFCQYIADLSQLYSTRSTYVVAETRRWYYSCCTCGRSGYRGTELATYLVAVKSVSSPRYHLTPRNSRLVRVLNPLSILLCAGFKTSCIHTVGSAVQQQYHLCLVQQTKQCGSSSSPSPTLQYYCTVLCPLLTVHPYLGLTLSPL